jgi:hypothetical protein
MVKRIEAVLLSAICVAFVGCASVEPASPVRQSVPAPAVGGMRAVETASQETHDQAVEVNEPSAQAVEVPDANASPTDEPNVVPTEPQVEVAAPTVKEPNESPAQAAVPSPATSFEDQYAAILATYVREDGLIDYGTLRRRRLELRPVLTVLDELDPNVHESWSQPEKLAFWINAYNLKMLDIIARNYPIESSWWLRLTWSPSDIRHIQGIWTDYRFIVMDEEFTLAEVEQRCFRRTFDDPRVYLALAYATQSGPPLCVRPYRGGDLDGQLDQQVKRFLSSPQGLQIDRRNMVVRLSALFKPSWRGKEFVGRYGTDKKFKSRDPATRAVLNFLTNYLSREDVEFLEVENYSIEYLNFDWRLNDTAKGY